MIKTEYEAWKENLSVTFDDEETYRDLFDFKQSFMPDTEKSLKNQNNEQQENKSKTDELD